MSCTSAYIVLSELIRKLQAMYLNGSFLSSCRSIFGSLYSSHFDAAVRRFNLSELPMLNLKLTRRISTRPFISLSKKILQFIYLFTVIRTINKSVKYKIKHSRLFLTEMIMTTDPNHNIDNNELVALIITLIIMTTDPDHNIDNELVTLIITTMIVN